MSPGVALLLWSLVLLEVKHVVFDFVLQTTYLYRNKGTYGHPAGFVHAGLHAVGSIPAVLIITKTAWLVVAILAAEFVVHYHVDWSKQQIDKRYGFTVNQSRYWIVFGVDQLAHQMTYVVILAVLARAANL